MGAPEGKLRILVVDDSQDFAETLKYELEKTAGFDVRIETRPTWALATARAYRPNLILCDIIMPEMDGGAVAAEIAADGELYRTPVVFLTAVVSKEAAGAQQVTIAGRSFVPKEASPKEIIACIEAELAK